MARIIKSRVKVKELPEKFKIIKKEPPAEVIGEEETEEEQEQGLEQTNFTPRASSSGLEAPVLEASSSSSQSQFSDTRERKKEYICENCGKVFISSAYYKRNSCSTKCANILSSIKRRKGSV